MSGRVIGLEVHSIGCLAIIPRARIRYAMLLKTGSLDNAVQEFSLAPPSWYTSNNTMLYKHGKPKRNKNS